MKYTSSRREMLKRSAMLALTGTSAAATAGKLGLISSAVADSSSISAEYRALVCVFLYGGSDSFNMFVPLEQSQYNAYRQSRTALSIERADLLTGPNSTIGFNPNMPQLRRMYDAGNLAVIPNAGNLIAPVTRLDYQNDSNLIPRNLFAHDDQREQWQKAWSSRPSTSINTGWGGRMADLLAARNNTSALPPQFSINGTNFWSPGGQTIPVSLDPINGLPLVDFLDNSERVQNLGRSNAYEAILNLDRNHPMEAQMARIHQRARNSSRELRGALQNSPDFQTPYESRNRLASQLRMVARLIAGRDLLGFNRQIFFVGMGGWDTHNNQAASLPGLVGALDSALASFAATIDELGLGNNITTFTASDFGRTLTINGDGTDHGWSGHDMVMGNSVRGGKLYGDLPNYTINGPDDAGDKGRIIPATSVNQYGAVLARWLGLTDAELNGVFPDLSNFNDSWRTELAFMDA